MEQFIKSRKRKWDLLQDLTVEEDEIFFGSNTSSSHEEDVVNVVSQVVAVIHEQKKQKKRECRVDRSHLKANWQKEYETCFCRHYSTKQQLSTHNNFK